MTAELPEALEIQGRAYKINADYRNILEIFEALSDDKLTNKEKAYISVKRLFREEIPARHFGEAVRQSFWFCDGGGIPKTEPEKFKIIDWNHDASLIFPAVSKAAGIIDIRSVEFLHWWTFLGLFGEVGEGIFSTVIHIRRKRLEGKKLEKWEREFFTKHKNLIILRTAEEQEAIDETEEFLKHIT